MTEQVKTAVVHPMDFEAVAKGDVIGQGQIELISQVRYTEDPERYRIEQMKLRSQIREHRPDLAVVTEKRCLRILTDVELPGYRQARLEHSVRALKTNVELGACLDRSKLTEIEQRRADCIDRHVAQAAIEAARVLRESRRGLLQLDGVADVARLSEGEE